MSTAYGDYLDDLDLAVLGKLFAREGPQGSSIQRLLRVDASASSIADATAPAPGSRPRNMLPLHWRTQPVILVSEDDAPRRFARDSFSPARRTHALWVSAAHVSRSGRPREWHLEVLERGHRRALLLVTHLRGRMSAAKLTKRQPPAPNTTYPPDIPLTCSCERERGFRGGVEKRSLGPESCRCGSTTRTRSVDASPNTTGQIVSRACSTRDQHEEPRISVAAVLMKR
jgi:hypothetical protein